MVPCRNRGFGHANNRGVMTSDARYVLFLNPDTEILEGTLAELVAWLDARPEVGMLSVKQMTPDGVVYPTIRRYPDALRALGECIGSERFPRTLGWLGPRVLTRGVYEREVECDWLTGAFLLVRAETLLGAGLFDERFFMSSEEVDLAYRITQAGWKVDARAAHDDPAPRAHGQAAERSDGGPVRLRPAPVRREALLASPSSDLPGTGRNAAPAAPAFERDPRPQPLPSGGRPLGAACTCRQRAPAVRAAAGRCRGAADEPAPTPVVVD